MAGSTDTRRSASRSQEAGNRRKWTLIAGLFGGLCNPAGMSWRIVITFPEMVRDKDNDLLHRVRNFGETLFRHFKENGRGSMSLEEIDRATDTLIVDRVRNADLKRTLRLLEQMAEVDFPERTPKITADKVAA
jgi:hypothetical protein